MGQEYVAENVLSTVLQQKWRLALWVLGSVIIGGIILVIVLALGAANPPRAGAILWETDSASNWPLFERKETVNLFRAPTPLPTPPFTLELSARNSGDAASAWGIWIGNSDTVHMIVVSREGYMSVSDDEALHWAEFMHIRSDLNKIYLDVTTDLNATLRINDEITWTGTLALTDNASWGIALYREPELSWQDIILYAA
jgi:hypothetical protein